MRNHAIAQTRRGMREQCFDVETVLRTPRDAERCSESEHVGAGCGTQPRQQPLFVVCAQARRQQQGEAIVIDACEYVVAARACAQTLCNGLAHAVGQRRQLDQHDDEIGFCIERQRACQTVDAAAIRQPGKFVVRFGMQLHLKPPREPMRHSSAHQFTSRDVSAYSPAMAKVVLASALSRWLPASAAKPSEDVMLDVPGKRLDEVLSGVFMRFPSLRGYVLDEHGAVRHHVAVFVDGTAITDKRRPTQTVGEHSEIYVMQALSGG